MPSELNDLINIILSSSSAGDHVKFGLPMSSSAHLLAWSVVKFKAGYEAAGQLDMMLDALRTPLDYFMAGWKGDKFIAQVCKYIICLGIPYVSVTANKSFINREETTR